MKMITNIDLGFILTISMSFGEYVFSAGLFQKTVKGDQNVKLNHAYPCENYSRRFKRTS